MKIGNNTCIDQGALSDTIISDGVKIDNLVHIAHNVQIGKNTLIIAINDGAVPRLVKTVGLVHLQV